MAIPKLNRNTNVKQFKFQPHSNSAAAIAAIPCWLFVLMSPNPIEFTKARSHEETVENFKSLVSELNRLIVDFRNKAFLHNGNAFYMVNLTGNHREGYQQLDGCAGGFIGLGLHMFPDEEIRKQLLPKSVVDVWAEE